VNGIVAYGAYLPYFRLDRKAIGESLGASAGSGTRSVASYDEDSTSMAVEAARAAMRVAPDARPGAVYFATASPAYLDKTNASAIHAALALDAQAAAFDMLGSVRSGAGAVWAAIDAGRPTLVALADIRTGLPGGGDEREGGDGAVAFLFGESRAALAEPVARASATAEFLERWRLPGDAVSRQWEERFGEHAYVPLGEAAVADALKQAGVSADAVSRWIVTGPHARASRRVAAAIGAAKGAVADDLATSVGNTGTAHAGLMLADALDRAKPDELIAVVSLADGCDVLILRTTAAIASRRPATPVAAQIAAGGRLTYATFLTWRGFLPREPPRRPDPVHRQPLPGVRRPARTAAARVREVPRRGPHDARAARRRPGDDRDVHRGPARLFALAARRRGGHRLRGRRAVPVRADRRRPGVRQDRRPRRDDVPTPLHRRLRPQLLLESTAAPRSLAAAC